MRIGPIALAGLAALHLAYLLRVAAGFDFDTPTQQNAIVVWSGKEFGLGGVALFAAVDVLVIIACIRSLRET